MKRTYIAILLLGCLIFDVGRNSSLVGYFAGVNNGSMQWVINYSTWLCAAFVLACLPTAMEGNMRYKAALLSAMFSMGAALMGHFTEDMQGTAQAESKSFHYTESARLTRELEECKTLPASVCSSADVRNQIKINSSKLAHLESSTTLKIYEVTVFGFTINPVSTAKLICLMLVGLFIPYFTADLANQLRSMPLGTKARTNEAETGTKSGVFQDKIQDKIKNVADKIGGGKGRKVIVASDDHDKILRAELKKIRKEKGVDYNPTKTELRGKGVGNGAVSWWHKNVMPNIATNVTSIEVAK